MLISAIGRDKQHHNSRGGNYKYYSPKYWFIAGSLHLKPISDAKGVWSRHQEIRKWQGFRLEKSENQYLVLRFSHSNVISHSTGVFCVLSGAAEGCRIRSCPLFNIEGTCLQLLSIKPESLLPHITLLTGSKNLTEIVNFQRISREC